MGITVGGVAVFGTGSEWLWTMLQFIALTITFAAIYRQLRAQRSANELRQMQMILSLWNDEAFLRARLAALIELKTNPDSSMTPDIRRVARFLDDLALQVQLGQLSARYVWEFFGTDVPFWWATLAPTLRRHALAIGEPESWSRVKTLYDTIGGVQRRHGVQKHIDSEEETTRRSAVESNIRNLRTQLGHLRDAKAGVIPDAPDHTTPTKESVQAVL